MLGETSVTKLEIPDTHSTKVSKRLNMQAGGKAMDHGVRNEIGNDVLATRMFSKRNIIEHSTGENDKFLSQNSFCRDQTMCLMTQEDNVIIPVCSYFRTRTWSRVARSHVKN